MRAVKIAGVIFLTAIVVIGILRIRGEILTAQSYSDGFGTIRVRALYPQPLSLGGLLGIRDQFYRCEFYRTPHEPLASAISLKGESYWPQEIKIVWEDARKATVSFDEAYFYKLESGVWSRIISPNR